MDLGLAGRVALVCGSTKGLGRAVAKVLAQEGARVAINGRHEDAVEHVAHQLSSEAAQAVMPFVADVGDSAQAEGLVERVHHEMGRLDVLFCNASGPPAASFTHQPAEAFQRALEVNLLSAVHLLTPPASRIPHPASRAFMQAIVKEQRAPGLKVTTVPKPSPGPGEVLIAVRHAGV